MKKIDLHVHTNASFDGDFSPKQIINLALKKHLRIIAITDHNSLDGIDGALEYARNKKIKIIPGVEISCKGESLFWNDIHILGLFIDHKNINLKKSLYRKPSVKGAIEVIRNSRGISILAHPGIYLKKIDEVINKFIECGGDGLEINYPHEKLYGFSEEKSKFLREKLRKIVKEKNLLISGGSDFHGSARNIQIGECGLDEEDFEKLKGKIPGDFKGKGIE